jgi:hypothetical protein
MISPLLRSLHWGESAQRWGQTTAPQWLGSNSAGVNQMSLTMSLTMLSVSRPGHSLSTPCQMYVIDNAGVKQRWGQTIVLDNVIDNASASRPGESISTPCQTHARKSYAWPHAWCFVLCNGPTQNKSPCEPLQLPSNTEAKQSGHRSPWRQQRRVLRQQDISLHVDSSSVCILVVCVVLKFGLSHRAMTLQTSPVLPCFISCTSWPPRIWHPLLFMRSMRGAKSSSATDPRHHFTSKLDWCCRAAGA